VVGVAVVKWVLIDSLAQRLAPGWQPMSVAPVFNASMGVGLLVAATMPAVYWLRRAKWDELLARRRRGGASDAPPSVALPMTIALTLLAAFAFTLELDRVVERGAALGGTLLWPATQLKLMSWTMLWTVALAVMAGAAAWIERDPARRRGTIHTLAVLMVLLGVKFVLADALLWRLGSRPDVPTLFNLQSLTALFVLGGLCGAFALVTRSGAADAAGARLRSAIGGLALLVLLVTGTLEVDRTFHGTPRHVAVSIFWALFALAAVIAGFRARIANLRYFALALFALTLLKVVTVDMAEAATGYRVLSFMGLGLLLLGTSVLYGKLSPKLLRAEGI
jgi:uncharacterized membrane protein